MNSEMISTIFDKLPRVGVFSFRYSGRPPETGNPENAKPQTRHYRGVSRFRMRSVGLGKIGS